MLLGVAFSSLVITQQSSIFVGLMTRTIGFLSDTPLPDLWVMDPKVQFVDDTKPLLDTDLLRVRGVEGVKWAVPLYKGIIRAKLSNGTFQNSNVVGLDDESLIGGPLQMVEGSLLDLRRADGVIVDEVGAKGKLAHPPDYPGGPRRPLRVGDYLELNEHRAVVVGIARVSRTFQSQPVIYTTYRRATTFAPRERKLLTFILVKASEGVALSTLSQRITAATGLAAFTNAEFKDKTIRYFLKYTGIPINFGIAIILGFIVGTAIVGQTFYNFTLDNLKYLGALKAMGAKNRILLQMILVQGLIVGALGYGIGVGAASLFYYLSKKSELAFRLPVELFWITGTAVLIICAIAAVISIQKVFRIEPAIVFKG
jgi:putative ABC transport system permease protein